MPGSQVYRACVLLFCLFLFVFLPLFACVFYSPCDPYCGLVVSLTRSLWVFLLLSHRYFGCFFNHHYHHTFHPRLSFPPRCARTCQHGGLFPRKNSDMLEIMQTYGSEVSDIVLPPRKTNIQKASVIRQFRRWNPNFLKYFYFRDGLWHPKLGKEAELERRSAARKLVAAAAAAATTTSSSAPAGPATTAAAGAASSLKSSVATSTFAVSMSQTPVQHSNYNTCANTNNTNNRNILEDSPHSEASTATSSSSRQQLQPLHPVCENHSDRQQHQHAQLQQRQHYHQEVNLDESFLQDSTINNNNNNTNTTNNKEDTDPSSLWTSTIHNSHKTHSSTITLLSANNNNNNNENNNAITTFTATSTTTSTSTTLLPESPSAPPHNTLVEQPEGYHRKRQWEEDDDDVIDQHVRSRSSNSNNGQPK